MYQRVIGIEFDIRRNQESLLNSLSGLTDKVDDIVSQISQTKNVTESLLVDIREMKIRQSKMENNTSNFHLKSDRSHDVTDAVVTETPVGYDFDKNEN